jgi:fructosamine-3-kinase
MATGEYESQVAMQKCIPDNVAKAVGVGPLEVDSTKSYFIVEFKDMRARKPSPAAVAAVLAKMHQASESPTGKFGFPVPTYKGYFPVNNDWCDKWEDWFAREFTQTLQNFYSRRGEDPELMGLFDEFAAKVIPRLLRPLETGGRTVKPVLCHSDLWHGNAALDLETQEPIIFDPCCLYGHNEGEPASLLV